MDAIPTGTVHDADVRNGLSRLLDAEARLAAMVAAAEAEGDGMVQAARAAVAEADAGLASRIDADAAGLSRRIAHERDARVSQIHAAAEVPVRRLLALPDEVIERLAEELERRFLTELWR